MKNALITGANKGIGLEFARQPYLLTPNMQALAKKYNKTIPQIIFRFALQIGILSLTGTTNPQHMSDDLNIFDFELTFEEIQSIENRETESDL